MFRGSVMRMFMPSYLALLPLMGVGGNGSTTWEARSRPLSNGDVRRGQVCPLSSPTQWKATEASQSRKAEEMSSSSLG